MQYDHMTMKSKIPSSSFKMFDGEDLSGGQRKKQQQNQMNGWVKQQVEDHETIKQQKKSEKETWDQNVLEQNQLRQSMEEEHTRRRVELEIANQQANVQLMKEKLDREQANRVTSQREQKEMVKGLAEHPFWTEEYFNQLIQKYNEKPVIPYHYKGMSEQQRKEIRNEQALQREQKEFDQQKAKEDKQMWDLYNEHNRKLLVTLEREKSKKQKDIMNFTRDNNLLSGQEQKINIKNMYA